MSQLRRMTPNEVKTRRLGATDPEAEAFAVSIVADVRRDGAAAVRREAERFGERTPEEPLIIARAELDAAVDRLSVDDRGVLERTAARIEAFAWAQRTSLRDLSVDVPGGRAGHAFVPVARAGAYAPGGRYPLPSSMLMTTIPARVAGCASIIAATPAPDDVMLAAAAIGGADAVLAVGGAHAVAALAYGWEGFEPCDVIVGPGNRWVTAAKRVVSDVVGIDMLAGPSELVVLADASAEPAVVAADLIAQAEHDADASAILVTVDARLAAAVDEELSRQLGELPTRDVARRGLANGYVCVARDLDEAIEVTNRIAPEHLQVITSRPREVAERIVHAGAVFLGTGSAEVFGDYGVGPNHTLPTGGSARRAAGLSVLDFLRPRTWIEMDEGDDALISDAARLARLEGLEGHARAAERRAVRSTSGMSPSDALRSHA